jgi:hypothetical protein
MKDRVVIVVEGGLIRNIASDKDIEVVVIDVDRITEGDPEEINLDYGKADEVGRAAVDRTIRDGENLVKQELKDLKRLKERRR